MRRDTLNYLVDTLALLAMLVMAATGLVIKYLLPPRVRGGEGLSLWGMTRHEWGDVHFWAAVGLAVLLVLHVALHWTWACVLTKRLLGLRGASPAPPRPAARLSYGSAFLVLLAALVAGFIWVGGRYVGRASEQVATRVSDSPRVAAGRGAHAEIHDELHGTTDIRGSMTLAELAAETGIDVDELKTALGVPVTEPGSWRLGALGRRYGFDMTAVREMVGRRQECSEAARDADNR